MCLVFTLNLVQLGISIGDILQWSCTQKRDYDAMFAGTKMDSLTPLVVGLEAFIVQGIYAHRAFTVRSSPPFVRTFEYGRKADDVSLVAVSDSLEKVGICGGCWTRDGRECLWGAHHHHP